jgi:hypothetical protein
MRDKSRGFHVLRHCGVPHFCGKTSIASIPPGEAMYSFLTNG